MGFVAPQLWNDEKVRNLPLATKAVFTYLLTGPESLLIPGLLNGDSDSLAGPLRASISEVEAAMQKLISVRLVERDQDARIIRIPNAPRYNAPPNGNVLSSWYKRWTQFIDSPLRNAHVASVRAAVELRIAEATKKKAKKGVVESWRCAWEETFGTADIHARQRDMFAQVFTPPIQQLKPLAEPLTLFAAEGSVVRSSPLSGSRESESLNSSDDGMMEDVGDEDPHERDQDLKRFPEPSFPDPDPDPRSLSGSRSQILDPDPRSSGPLAAVLPLPTAFAEGTSPGFTSAAGLPGKLWELQETLRARIPGALPRKGTGELLRSVDRCLTELSIDEVTAVRVLQSYLDHSPGHFDGIENWRPENVRRQIQRWLTPSMKRTAHHVATGREEYGSGGAAVPGNAAARKMT